MYLISGNDNWSFSNFEHRKFVSVRVDLELCIHLKALHAMTMNTIHVQYMYSYIKKKTHEFQEKVYGTNASMYLCTELGTKSLFCYSLLLLLALDSMCNNVRSNDLNLYFYFRSNSLHILLVTVSNGNDQPIHFV
jgi:hypothetical protein